jgi:putative oxidoreductase
MTIAALIKRFNCLCEGLPLVLIQILARWSMAATFWLSGQTKVQGFAINIVEGQFVLGWPRFSDSAIDLFKDEYKLPLLPPELAAGLAATAEHVFPVLLLLGLATRASALALLGMTLVIQLFVYPGAWPIHGTWAVALLVLVRFGAGPLSLDALISRNAR